MRTDLFDYIPTRGSKSVSSVVDYCLFNITNGATVGSILTSPHLPDAQIMAPNHAPIYAIFNLTNIYTSYYFELLQHEDFLYTGVASVQAVRD